MAFVITEPCISTCDTACVAVCPVDCIHILEITPTLGTYVPDVAEIAHA